MHILYSQTAIDWSKGFVKPTMPGSGMIASISLQLGRNLSRWCCVSRSCFTNPKFIHEFVISSRFATAHAWGPGRNYTCKSITSPQNNELKSAKPWDIITEWAFPSNGFPVEFLCCFAQSRSRWHHLYRSSKVLRFKESSPHTSARASWFCVDLG